MPFSRDQFFDVFEAYNVAVWPAQLFFYLLALVTVTLAGLGVRNSRAVVMPIIGFLWLWAGVAYHFVFFSRINHAAWLFGGLFLVEGALLIWNGVAQRRLAVEGAGPARRGTPFPRSRAAGADSRALAAAIRSSSMERSNAASTSSKM